MSEEKCSHCGANFFNSDHKKKDQRGGVGRGSTIENKIVLYCKLLFRFKFKCCYRKKGF